MGMVWEIDLPANQQSVLLALADHADHDGTHARPSVALLAWKTGYSERQVRYVLKAIREAGLIEVTSHGKGGRHHPTEYRLCLERGTPKTPLRGPDNPATIIAGNDTTNPAHFAPFNEETLQSETQTLQPSVGNPAIAVADEPSEPSKNRIAEQTKKRKLKSEREQDPLFNAIAEAWKGQPYQTGLLTETQASLVGMVTSELRAVGATPEEVPAEWQRIKATFDNPGPRALSAHWKTEVAAKEQSLREQVHAMYPPLD